MLSEKESGSKADDEGGRGIYPKGDANKTDRQADRQPASLVATCTFEYVPVGGQASLLY